MLTGTANNNLRIASLNIDRGLFDKEERLINTLEEHELDICAVSEVDIKDFDETKPFSIEGFNGPVLIHISPYRGREQIQNESCVLLNPILK